MHWKLKSLAFNIFELPGGNFAHRLAQQKLTGSAQRDMSGGEDGRYQTVFRRHLAAFRDCGVPLDRAHYLEFGAGYDLAANIYYYCMGVGHQTLVDIAPILQMDQVERMIRWYQSHPPLGFVRKPANTLREMNIEYISPKRLQDVTGKFDIISTIDTMEHIPASEVPDIARSCAALLGDSGVCVMSIDYTDHYSHGDKSITPYNFLQYSGAAWRRYNSARHFQSRSRHPSYRSAFEGAGLAVKEAHIELPDGWEDRLARVCLHPDFAGLSPRDIAIQRATLVIRQ